jgi:lipid A 3-O-deacylase
MHRSVATSVRRIAGVLALLVAVAAGAVERDGALPALAPYVIGSAGTFAVDDDAGRPWLVGAQYRARPLTALRLRPGAGIDAGRDDLLYAYGDLARDFELSPRWWLTLSLAAGWLENGETIGAPYEVEFRSGLAVARRYDSGLRVGLAFHHLSNAGLDRRNGGSESLVLFCGLPLGR